MHLEEAAAQDRTWRFWAVVAIVSALLFSVVFGFIVLPIIQGRSAELGAYVAICRALGIAPGSPTARQPVSEARAEPTTRVAWSAALLASLEKPSKASAQLAAGCAACHGENGRSANPQFPDLAGQSAVAIYKQLHDFKSASRVNATMSPMAQPLTDAQIVDLAAHFAAFAPRAIAPTAPQPVPEAISRLVTRGDPARELPPCNACHGSNAGGPIETPYLSRQSAAYLAAQLRAFKSGARKNDIYGRMRSVAAKLSDAEIEGLAAFYSTTLSY